MNTTRLFIGMPLQAPWPESLPKGRVLPQKARHATLLFLGSIPRSFVPTIIEQMPSIPLTSIASGFFDHLLLLPKHFPQVVAFGIEFLDPWIYTYQKSLVQIAKTWPSKEDRRPWLPHATICRRPFAAPDWRKAFMPLPCFAKSIHLYESLCHSHYEIIHTLELLPPFEEIAHTADRAFRVYGKNLQDLYHHAWLALAFQTPSLLNYREQNPTLRTLDDVITTLNRSISQCDQKEGCSMKAVSFHGEIEPFKDHCLQWEMIVDI